MRDRLSDSPRLPYLRSQQGYEVYEVSRYSVRDLQSRLSYFHSEQSTHGERMKVFDGVCVCNSIKFFQDHLLKQGKKTDTGKRGHPTELEGFKKQTSLLGQDLKVSYTSVHLHPFQEFKTSDTSARQEIKTSYTSARYDLKNSYTISLLLFMINR